MRILMDTHVLIWVLAEPQRLSDETLASIESAADEVLFSAASIWEIAIKRRLRRIDLPFEPAEIVRSAAGAGYVELPLRATAAALVAELPL
jgi:PIN domain nuclease of toxin-antitoxin system